MAAPGSLLSILKSTRVVVVLGAGGVGKTTSSIVMALLGARMGRKVALLSIDPAKRLAAALGIPLGNQLRRIALPADWGVVAGGSVDAAMLDQKAVFDAMVQRHAPGDAAAAKILAHPVYKAVSSHLGGPLEYMALAKLQELVDDHRYDMIVLDTPPDTQALDFLARPNLLAGFTDHKVMTWLIKPFLMASRFGLGKLLSASEKLMGGIAKVTGMQALQSFAEFLVLMQDVIAGFNKSGERIVAMLHQEDTRFLLVSVPSAAAVRSGIGLLAQLEAEGYSAELLLFNKCLPTRVAFELEQPDHVTSPELALLKKRASGEARLIAKLTAAAAAGEAPPYLLRLAEEELEIGNLEAIRTLVDKIAEQ